MFRAISLVFIVSPLASDAADPTSKSKNHADLFTYLKDGTEFVEPSNLTIVGRTDPAGKVVVPTKPEKSETMTTTITRVRAVGGGTLYAFRIVYSSGPRPMTEHWLLTETGLYLADETGITLTDAPIIPSDMTVGRSWKVKIPGGPEMTIKAEAKEKVKTQAGEFDSYRLKMTRSEGGTAVSWFAPKAGFVKARTTEDGKTRTSEILRLKLGN